MASHQNIYKKKGARFGNVGERRIIRAFEETENRKHRRSTAFAINRKIAEPNTSSASNALGSQQAQSNAPNGQTEDRRTKLLKWKAEKELQRKLQNQMKPPAFRTGVYHHKLNSPIFLHQSLPAAKPHKPATPRITRATAKRIAAKKDCVVKEKVPAVPTYPAKATRIVKNSANAKNLETSFAPENHQFKPPMGLPSLQLFGRDALDDAKIEPESLPVYFSPYVVSARGKKAAREEQLHNLQLTEYIIGEPLIDETNSQSDMLDRVEEVTTSHFRTITEKEVMKLSALCRHWGAIKTNDNVPDDAQLIINQAIGQTNLLIDKKIEQFKRLIEDCENGSGEQLVTCQDLQGFWDMMYMQVENCNSRFNKITQLQERNWKEEEPEIVKKVVVKKSAANKKIIPSKSTAVRDMIRAARKKQMESQKTENLADATIGESGSSASVDPSRLSLIKFDGGFFMVESPKKSVTPKSSRKSVPLQPAFLAEAAHRRSALNLLRLSQILKPPDIKPVEVELDPTIPYINSQQTPGRSILKQTDSNESASYIKKSQNKVNFSKNPKTPKNNISWLGDSNNPMYGAEAENFEFSTDLNIKKQLILSDSDSDLQETEDYQEDKSKASDCREFNLSDEGILKNYNGKDKSAMNSLGKESMNTMRTTRKMPTERNDKIVDKSLHLQAEDTETPHTNENFTINEHQKENEKPNSPEMRNRRRSTRKSVKFTGEQCTACSEVKLVYPMTPRVKRRTSKLLDTPNVNKSSTEQTNVETPSTKISADLIVWDTPKDPPPRVRRSLRLQKANR